MEAKHLANCIDCYESLRRACEKAGGGISVTLLKDMSAVELIHFIANNGIRFQYNGRTNESVQESNRHLTAG